VLLLATLLVCGCKDKAPQSGAGAAGSAQTAAHAASDAATAGSSGSGSGSQAADAASRDLLAAATVYVEKLRAIPVTVRAAKKAPTKCKPEALAAVAEADRKAVVLELNRLDKMVGNKIDYTVDPTFFVMELESQNAGELSDVDEFHKGTRKTTPNLGWMKQLMTPFVVVVRADKLDVPQLEGKNRFWPGEFRGSIYVFDAASAQLLCGAPLKFKSTAKLTQMRTSLVDKKTGRALYSETDDPATLIKKDFTERGRAAIRAFLEKAAPGVQPLQKT
jgi:hypothetical protein